MGVPCAGDSAGQVNASATASYLLHMGALLRSTRQAKRSIKEDLMLAKLPSKPTVVVVQRLLQCAPTKAALSNVAQLMDYLDGLTQRDSEGLMAYFDRRLQELKELAAPQPEMEQPQ